MSDESGYTDAWGEDEHSQGRDKAQQGTEVEAGPAKETDGSSFGDRREGHSDQ